MFTLPLRDRFIRCCAPVIDPNKSQASAIVPNYDRARRIGSTALPNEIMDDQHHFYQSAHNKNPTQKTSYALPSFKSNPAPVSSHASSLIPWVIGYPSCGQLSWSNHSDIRPSWTVSSPGPDHCGDELTNSSRLWFACWESSCDGVTFANYGNYRRHLREKHGSWERTICNACGKTFTRPTAKDRHIREARCKGGTYNGSCSFNFDPSNGSQYTTGSPNDSPGGLFVNSNGQDLACTFSTRTLGD